MSHLQIAMSLWGVVIFIAIATVISALGALFGMRNILTALLVTVAWYGGWAALIIYTIYALVRP